MLSCNLQDRNVAKLQTARLEYYQIAGWKINVLLSCELQDRNAAKLKFSR